jgi:predicted  nucleic acid-binding Zn-ribbon protein
MNIRQYEAQASKLPCTYPDIALVLRQVAKLREEWTTAKKRARSLTDALQTLVEISAEKEGLDFVLDEVNDRLERTAQRMEELSGEMYALEGVLEDAVWALEAQ